MILLFSLLNLITSFIEIYILYRIFSLLLHDKRRTLYRRTDVILAIIGTIIVQIFNHLKNFSYFTILFFVLFISISAMFLYECNYITLFAVSSFYLLCLSCFDFLVFSICSNIFIRQDDFMLLISETSLLRFIIIITIKVLWVLVYLILKNKFYKLALKKNYMYTILFVSGAGFLGFVYLAKQTIRGLGFEMTERWVLYVCLLSLFFFSIYFVIRNKEVKMKLDFMNMRNNLLEENYNTINNIYMDNAKLYHDLNNHLNILYQLLDEGNTGEAKEYIKQISKPILILSKTVWTGVDVIDVIINSKLEKMQSKNIDAEIKVEYPHNSTILPNDMCSVLANLLDNAIEASEKVLDNRKVSLTMRRINSFMLIKVTNTCIEANRKFGNIPSTTKENKYLHGWGLPSVQGIVKKYSGSMECLNENNTFTVKILLFF